MERMSTLTPERLLNTELENITLELADIKIGKSYQSPNEAERVADRAWATARAHSASVGTGLEHMLRAVDHEYYMKLRMKVAGTVNLPTPDITKENLADLFTKRLDSATSQVLTRIDVAQAFLCSDSYKRSTRRTLKKRAPCR